MKLNINKIIASLSGAGFFLFLLTTPEDMWPEIIERCYRFGGNIFLIIILFGFFTIVKDSRDRRKLRKLYARCND